MTALTAFTASTSVPDPRRSSADSVRRFCRGELPLDARLQPWMKALLANESEQLHDAVQRFGSPVNVIATGPFRQNAECLQSIARRHQVDLKVYFARKANKCLSFVDAGRAVDVGMDVASEAECRQTLDRGLPGRDIVCTAAIKTESLIELCVRHGVKLVIDNLQELELVTSIAVRVGRAARLAIRLSGFEHQGKRLESRFGFDLSQVNDLLDRLADAPPASYQLIGLHFHLDGYDREQRVSAICQSLTLVDRLRRIGHPVAALDIGGGFPICYLNNQQQWSSFWREHDRALLQQRSPVTWQNHGLGRMVIDGKLHGRRNCYPYWQSPTRDDWLDGILSAAGPDGGSVADSIRLRNLQLQCEPGRSLLDGCGITVARVEFCKQHVGGDWLIGVAMNRTQCRTSSDDFLVDPLLVKANDADSANTTNQTSGQGPTAKSGFLVGAYCTESEFLQLRRLKFPYGIERGDLIVLPNTAGYFMHFLESRSHQYPLAKNLVLETGETMHLRLDDIDQDSSS